MTPFRLRSTAATASITGLLAAAAGMSLERAAGSTLYPTLAGPLVLAVTALALALQPRRLTEYLALAVPVVLAVGLVVSAVMAPTFVDQLLDVANGGTFLGSVLHLFGLAVAVIGGIGVVSRPRSAPNPSLS